MLIQLLVSNGLQVAQKLGQRPCTTCTCMYTINHKERILQFCNFLIHNYTCLYVMYQLGADSNQVWIFYDFLKLLIQVFMLYRKFELMSIKIILNKFLICQKPCSDYQT